MYKDVKPYVPPEKTHIERINDAFELQETLDTPRSKSQQATSTL